MSPRGIPREWTLDELRMIWEFDGDEGQTTVTDAAREMGVSHSHWYGMRARLQSAGGPEQLFEQMQKAKKYRYNRASNGRVRAGTKTPDTLEDALSRIYLIRVGGSGRDGGQEQFMVTIPPLLARAFIATHGQRIVYEPCEAGILLKPVPKVAIPPLPDWMDD
jgi:hypothetical protein